MKTTKPQTPPTELKDPPVETKPPITIAEVAEVLHGDGEHDSAHTPLTPTLNDEASEAPPLETQVAETIPTSALPEPVAAITPAPPVVHPNATPAVNGTARFYKKIQVAMPLYVGETRIKFDVLGDNIGVIKLDPHTDARTIEVLDQFAQAKKGGVVAIDEEMFGMLKKKHPFQSSAPRFKPQEKLRVWESKPRRLSPSVSAKGAEVAGNIRHSPVVSGSGGSAGSTDGGAAGAGTPAVFSPNLQRKSASNVLKSGVLKTPASGQFRPGVAPPPFPPPK